MICWAVQSKVVLLGSVKLEGLPPLRAYQAKVNVEFEVDVDGILHVRVKDDANKDNNAKS